MRLERISLQPTLLDNRSLNNLTRGLVIVGLPILFLSVGREFLEPLAIAALLSFILAPVIRFLRGLGIWRTPAVIITVLAALGILAGLGSTLAVQIAQLAQEVPRSRTHLVTKRGSWVAPPYLQRS